MRTLTLMFALVAGCGQRSAPGRDLGVLMDLGGDLSAAPTGDLAFDCAGTPIAGTCVERFFRPFVACFAPAGSCGEFGRGSLCWQSGAQYELDYPGLSSSWSMNGQTCLRWTGYADYPTPREQYCTSDSSPCTIEHSVDDGGLYHYWAVGGLIYDASSGTFTCPDGTQVSAPNDFGGCPALNAILHPGCEQSGWSCP